MHLSYYNIVLDSKDLRLEDEFFFRCYKGIVCFNRCCYDVKLLLTPYDLLRLKKNLRVSTEEFIENYGEVFIGEVTQLPVISINMNPYDYSCPFLDEKEGCKVYPDRPSSCRIYPLARYVTEKDGEKIELYKIIRETHCKGHYEKRPIKVKAYLEEQELPTYHYFNDLWGEVVLKRQKFSDIPLTGDLLELIYLLAYDLETLKKEIKKGELTSYFTKGDITLPIQELLEKSLKIIRDEILSEKTLNW